MKDFTITLTDGGVIRGGPNNSDGPYSMFQEPHGVVVHYLAANRTETYPWHRVHLVSWTGTH